MSELACLDGVIAPADETRISVTDDGLLRGDGVFEVIRVYGGRPLLLRDHVDRMDASASNIRLGDAFPSQALEAEAHELLDARGESFDGCLRLVVTRGGRRLLLTEPLPPRPEVARLATVTYAPTRTLDGIKSLSYAANMLCTRIAREHGYDEALMTTPHGRVLEAPTSSFFWVSDDGALCTPPLEDHILASITRARLIELLDVEERSVGTVELLDTAREAFLASTVLEIQPVSALDGRQLPAPGEVTATAAAAFAEFRAASMAAS
jgi:branched-chain amino acid aminotransferase